MPSGVVNDDDNDIIELHRLHAYGQLELTVG